MSTVLRHKGGVITEERFQKMTAVQWLFHYKECLRAEEQEAKEKKSILQLLELYAMYSHPNMDIHKLAQKIEERKLRENAPQMKQELEADYELAMSVLPQMLQVKLEEEEEKPILPVSNRKKKKRKKKKDL